MKQPFLILAFFALLFSALPFAEAFGQAKADIIFNEMNHDFGVIQQGVPAEFVFSFENMSKDPIRLKNVKASCGCTTPKWTQDPVAPGTKGEIVVKYNAANLGKFTKSITVTYDSTNAKPPVVVYITGEVKMPEPQEPVYEYKYTQGNLGFDQILQDAGTVNTDGSTTLEFHVKNIGPQKVVFSGGFRANKMFGVKPQHYELIPGEKTTIRVILLGKEAEKWQAYSEDLFITTDDASQPEKKVTITGTINKVWTTEELAEAPNIVFERPDYNGGQVIDGEKLTVSYTFTNTGKKPLEIESAKASCGCTTPELKERIIQPGATSEITAVFDSRGRGGKQTKTITVKSNDPDNGTVVLKLECEVIADPFHQGAAGSAPITPGGSH